MKIAVAGAGAFGTGLAIALCANDPVLLWARDAEHVAAMQEDRQNRSRLPGITFPDNLTVTNDAARLAGADVILIAIPAQKMQAWIAENRHYLASKHLVACCKGIDLETLTGPGSAIGGLLPDAMPAVLTGPSFADDIARGLPAALTLACEDTDAGEHLQAVLSTPAMRLYRTTDLRGAELGGALKNVIAIACGVCMGAGYGESARAAVITRGFAEMQRLGAALGADPETLAGLSGFGDLALTCTSDRSRNYRFGLSIGRREPFDPSITVEGAATAEAVGLLSEKLALDLPINSVVRALSTGKIDPDKALSTLLSRPLKEE